MKKILLTNIGNRNIIYKGEMFHDIFKKNQSKSFLDWSKELLDNYDDYKDELDINIINPLVDTEDKPNKIILFYSNQLKYETRTNQDTIYEANIIKKLLIGKYKYLDEQISLEEIESVVVDNGNLIRYYRRFLKQLLNKEKDVFLTICDAGGTAQQKMSLKLIAEFVLQKDKYEVKYTEKNKLISDVNVDEYRKIISQEQAIKLVHLGQYAAANELLGYDSIGFFQFEKDWKKNIYAYTYFRYIGDAKLAKANLNNLSNINDLFLKACKNMDPDFNLKGMENVLSKEKIFRLTDYLHKAEFLFSIEQFSSSILAFSQFYEYLFDENIKKIYGKRKYKKASFGDKEALSDFEKWITSYCVNEIKRYKGRYKKHQIEPSILSIKCIVAKNSKSSLISDIAKILSQHIDFTDDANSEKGFINKLRNIIAHNGKYLTKNDLDLKEGIGFFYKDLLYRIIKIFDFKSENPFVHLNNLIEKNLRQ